MNKNTTHKDSLDVCAGLPLEDHELDSVSGGWFCCFVPTASGEQMRAAETFAQALQKAAQV